MIQLTKLNGDIFFINPHLIERIEARPDTTITMDSQVQYIAKDKIEDVIAKIVEYRKKLFPGEQE